MIKFLSKIKVSFIDWLVATLILLVLTFSFFGYLDPIKKLLASESLTFEIGKFSISVYQVLKGFMALIILFWLVGIILNLGETRLKQLRKIKASNRALLIKAFQVTVYFLAFLIGLDVLGIDLTALTVFGGAVGIGLGFGLQKITSNFISGLILLFEKSVEAGDLVEIGNGTMGFVKQTGARYTLIETFESREIMIPNEDFITNQVTNWTFSNSQGRIDITIGVSYGSNLDKVSALIVEAAKEHPRCATEPKPECFLENFGDSSINFTLYFWVDDIIAGRKRPRSDVLFTIWRKFKKHNIEIPFPQRDLHIKNPEKLK